MNSAIVLCTGINSTRKLILENVGHIVVTARCSAEIKSACHDHQFDVAVIGQTGKTHNPEWADLYSHALPECQNP